MCSLPTTRQNSQGQIQSTHEKCPHDSKLGLTSRGVGATGAPVSLTTSPPPVGVEKTHHQLCTLVIVIVSIAQLLVSEDSQNRSSLQPDPLTRSWTRPTHCHLPIWKSFIRSHPADIVCSSAAGDISVSRRARVMEREAGRRLEGRRVLLSGVVLTSTYRQHSRCGETERTQPVW